MDFDPYDPATVADPYPVHAWLRANDPVHYCEKIGVWFLTRYEEVHAALMDPGTFSSARYLYLDQDPDDIVRTMQSLDPPTHDRLRALARDAFSRRRVAALEPFMRGLVRDLLAGFEGREEIDLSGELCWPYPATVIFEMLGVPEADRAPFQSWAHDLADHANQGQGLEATRAIYAYFEALVAERTARPQGDLVSALIAAETETGEQMSPEELVSACYLIMVAGHETTTHLLGNTLAILAERPDLRRALAAKPGLASKNGLASTPGLVETAVEEFLRFVSPAQGITRTTMREVEIGGRTIPKGAPVHLALASANRDEGVFARPDELDLARSPNRHLALGFGIHFCLGAKLARLETRVALEEILAAMPDFELACESPPRTRSPLIRGLAALPVRVSRNAA